MEEGILTATREKYWSELTETEKIERLRDYAKRVEHLTERVNELETLIKNHKHLDGEIVTTLQHSLRERGYFPKGCFSCEKCQDQVRI